MQIPLELQEHCYRLLHAQQWAEVVQQIDDVVDEAGLFSKGDTDDDSSEDDEGNHPTWLYNDGYRWTRFYYCRPALLLHTTVVEDWGYRTQDVIATNISLRNNVFKNTIYAHSGCFSIPVSSSVDEKECEWHDFCYISIPDELVLCVFFFVLLISFVLYEIALDTIK